MSHDPAPYRLDTPVTIFDNDINGKCKNFNNFAIPIHIEMLYRLTTLLHRYIYKIVLIYG